MGTFILFVVAALVASFLKPFVAAAMAAGLAIINREIKAQVNTKPAAKSKRSNKPPMPKHQDIQH